MNNMVLQEFEHVAPHGIYVALVGELFDADGSEVEYDSIQE